MKRTVAFAGRIVSFYKDGFMNMPEWGRRVWIIILIKLFIMFAILRIFLFQDFLEKKYDNDMQRSEFVLNQLINSPGEND
jgi:hypothetical protein